MYIGYIEKAFEELTKLHPDLNLDEFEVIPCENKTRITREYIEFDIPPFEGDVLYIDRDIIVVKDDSDHKILYFVSRRLATTIPEVGNKVKVTPYARRNFDGSRADGCKFDNGFYSDFDNPYTWGSSTTLPFERPKGERLGKVYDLINDYTKHEELYLTHLLVDANASSFVVCDNEVNGNDDAPPIILFKFSNNYGSGSLQIMALEEEVWLLHWKNGLVHNDWTLSYEEFGKCLFQLLDSKESRKIKIDIL